LAATWPPIGRSLTADRLLPGRVRAAEGPLAFSVKYPKLL
jgi:hypothetical protein